MGNKQPKQLKFLFISSDKFPPFRVDVSVLFGKELAARGHVIDWILQSEATCKKPYEVLWSGCRVFVGPTDNGTSLLSRFRKHIYSIWHDFKLVGLARKNDYDFVQVKDKFISALLAIVVSKIKKIKFIYWLSYPFPEASLYRAKEGIARYPFLYYLRGIMQKLLLYKIILPLADQVFVQSEQMKRDLVALGVGGGRLFPVPMGVDLGIFPYRENYNEEHTNRSVVYVGTLTKVRRMDFLIRVFGKVIHEIDDAVLYVIGDSTDPNDVEALISEAKKIGVDKSIIFTGRLPREKALEYVDRSQVCVSPFFPIPILNSTSPTKLIEYMAMGKAVVVNDHPEQRLVISESGGGICVSWNEEDFANAIIMLLTHPTLAREMGVRGRNYVKEKRDYKKIAMMVEGQYFNVIDMA